MQCHHEPAVPWYQHASETIPVAITIEKHAGSSVATVLGRLRVIMNCPIERLDAGRLAGPQRHPPEASLPLSSTEEQTERAAERTQLEIQDAPS